MRKTMAPENQMLAPDQPAGLIAYLSSDEADGITGTVVPIDCAITCYGTPTAVATCPSLRLAPASAAPAWRPSVGTAGGCAGTVAAWTSPSPPRPNALQAELLDFMDAPRVPGRARVRPADRRVGRPAPTTRR